MNTLLLKEAEFCASIIDTHWQVVPCLPAGEWMLQIQTLIITN